jgi:hypothetical protein
MGLDVFDFTEMKSGSRAVMVHGIVWIRLPAQDPHKRAAQKHEFQQPNFEEN